jgi:hypothetical protein
MIAPLLCKLPVAAGLLLASGLATLLYFLAANRCGSPMLSVP